MSFAISDRFSFISCWYLNIIWGVDHTVIHSLMLAFLMTTLSPFSTCCLARGVVLDQVEKADFADSTARSISLKRRKVNCMNNKCSSQASNAETVEVCRPAVSTEGPW